MVAVSLHKHKWYAKIKLHKGEGMKKSKITDFILTAGALAISAGVALLAALKMIDTNTAIVFVALSVACVAMSLIDFESSTTSTPSKKAKKRR